VPSREIFALILLEAGVLGVIGTVLGLVLGVLLGRGAVQLVTQTINDLFFVVSVREIEIPTFTLLKGTAIGVLAALIGAAIPAWEATSVPPAGALKRSNVEERPTHFSGSASANWSVDPWRAVADPDWNLFLWWALWHQLCAVVADFTIGCKRCNGWRKTAAIAYGAPFITRSLSHPRWLP
jgi:hypothetical protein